MSWFTDLLQAIPLVTVLREKVSTFEAKNKELEAKNKELQAQVDSLKKENGELKEQLDHFLHKSDLLDLKEIQIQIIYALYEHQQLSIDKLEEILGQRASVIEPHLQELIIHQYVSCPSGVMYPKMYKLIKNGRDFILKK